MQDKNGNLHTAYLKCLFVTGGALEVCTGPRIEDILLMTRDSFEVHSHLKGPGMSLK